MDSSKSPLSTSTAILIGSVLISVAVLVSGGVITGKGGAKNVANNAPVQEAPSQQGKTEADIIKNLKTYAGKLSLDQNKFNSCLDSGSKASLVATDLKDGAAAGVQGTPSHFINGRPMFIGAAPFEQFKKVIDEEINKSAVDAERADVSTGNIPPLGNVNAPVTLIEFSDYQCPFCARFYQGAEAQIKKEYVDSGKVKIYFRDFPLTQIHPGAQKAAEAARCAGDQGKYWEYHDLIFENQPSIF